MSARVTQLTEGPDSLAYVVEMKWRNRELLVWDVVSSRTAASSEKEGDVLSVEEVPLLLYCCRATNWKLSDRSSPTLSKSLIISCDSHIHRKRKRLCVNELERKEPVSQRVFRLHGLVLSVIHQRIYSLRQFYKYRVSCWISISCVSLCSETSLNSNDAAWSATSSAFLH